MPPRRPALPLSRRALAAGAVALAVGGLAGCGPKSPKPDKGTEGKDHELLLRSANMYWEAVRWADGERAGMFIENTQERVIFMDWMQDERSRYRYEDIVVIQVQMGPKLDPPVDGKRREATVWARTSGYALPEQILETDRIRQGWYRTDQGWFVAWERPDEDG